MKIFLIEALAFCFLFTLFVVYPLSRNPLKSLYNYPPAIRDRAVKLGLCKIKDTKLTPKVIMLKGAVCVIYALILSLVVRHINGATEFVPAFLTSYGLWLAVTWYDALIVDCLWFCHSEKVKVSGTEDMKEYKDYLFHIKESFKGSLIGLPVCLIAGILAKFL